MDMTDNTKSETDLRESSRYGWVIVIACFGINTLVLGYIKCFGILFVEFIQEFNASASMTSLVMGLTSASTSVMSLLVLNVLMERVTIRKIALAGSGFASAGVLLTSCAVNIYFLLLSQSFLVGSAQGLMYGPGIVLIGQYFTQRRTLAIAVATSGVSTGAILVPLLLRYLLDQYGLRQALFIMGGIMMQTFVFAALYRSPDSSVRNKHDISVNENKCMENCSHYCETSRFQEKERVNYEVTDGRDSDSGEFIVDESRIGQESQREDTCSNSSHIKNANCPMLNQDFEFPNQEKETYHLEQDNSFTGVGTTAYQTMDQDDKELYNSWCSVASTFFMHGRHSCDPPLYQHTHHYSRHTDSVCLSTVSLHTSNKDALTKYDARAKEPKSFLSIIRSNLRLFKNSRFLIIFGFTFFGIIGTCLFPAFIPPLCKEKGLTDVQAALLVSVYACLDLVSRAASGVIAEVFSVNRRCMLVGMFIVLGLIYQFTSYYSNFPLMIMFVVLFGLINGVYAAFHPPLVADFLGTNHFAKVFGFVQVFHGAALSAAFPVLGYLRDLTGTYATSFCVLGLSQFLGALFLILEPLTRT